MSVPLHTSVTATLDMAGIEYQILWHQTPATSIEDAARQRGVQPEKMVKTMLLEDMGGLHALACLPGNKQVDPKKVRAHLQCRRMTCVKAERVRQITGFTPGTVTPIGLPNKLPVIIDPQLLDHEFITISSGDNMAGLAIQRDKLFQLLDAEYVPICRDTESNP
ncbi:aminoacyl-tRNA deacylase [Thaumasiovibrio sp. DFM-14]|uniref:aminoacyl-tRNA deacylase n=1 Tax=Thaumasiovibrio sp. DFM-14 TaxID=3384792 RepID=UPI0039A10293